MKKILLCAYFIVPFSIYLYTLHPAVSPYRDSGDLTVAAETLGIAHPPGYPLYVLAGKAFTQVFALGNAGYAMNVMSAFFGAAALFLLALAILRLYPGAVFPAVAVLFIAFTPAYWRLSQVSEMYSLNAFLAALIIFIGARLAGKTGAAAVTTVYLLSLLCGLSCANHPTIVFILPGLVWFVLSLKALSVKQYMACAFLFAAGLAAYVFMPLRAAAHPVLQWGDLSTLENFFRAVTRADYGGLKLHPEQSRFSWTAPLILAHLGVYLRSLAEQFTVLGVLAGGAGMVLERKNRYFRYLFITLFISGPLFIIFSNLPPAEKTTLPILEPHLVLPNLIFALFIAAAVKKAGEKGLPARAVIIILAAVLFLQKMPLCGYRNDFYAYDYGKNLLRTAPPDSIIYDPDDPTMFITGYLKTVEGLRPDIKIAAFFRTRWGYELIKRRYPEILPPKDIPSGQELARVLLDYNRGKIPVLAELPSKFPPGELSYPIGLLYKLSERGEFLPSAGAFSLYLNHGRLASVRQNDFFTNQIISYYAAAHNNLGLSFARLRKDGEARSQYLEALSIDPGLEAALNNMGSLEFALKNFPEAEKWFLRLLKLNPASASALYNAGITYRAMGNSQAAVNHLEQAWRGRTYPDAGNELGLIYLETGRAQEAELLFKAVISSYPGYRLAYYNLGLAQKQLGKYEDSRRSFQAYLDGAADPADREETLSMIRSLPKQ